MADRRCLSVAGRCGAAAATGPTVASSWLAILFSLALASFIGCASAGPARDVRGGAVPGAEFRHPPWEIPRAEWRTQRIVRMRYDGPEGNGTLRLVLRFDSPDRFLVSASDLLGRRWWELNVQEGGALVLWVRERTFCRYRGDLEIPALSLGPVPAGAVAALLMFRLPAPPLDPGIWDSAAGGGAQTGVVDLDYEDRWGRRWTATAAARGPTGWSLWRGVEERASWSVDAGGMARLLEPATDLELQWVQRRPSAELREELAAPVVPNGYQPGVCGPSR